MTKKIKISTIIATLLYFTFGATFLHANSHPDPLSIFRDKSLRPHRVSRHKRSHKVIWVASKRTLASYGRMKGEYLGAVHNSPAIESKLSPSIYTKHVKTKKAYLENKAIDGPLPQDYSRLFFQSKTLLPLDKTQIKIIVKKSIQRIFVYKNLKQLYTFKSSTGKPGHWTVTGTFKPISLERMHYSRKYFNSPMPWSVFFHRGFAIHGTENISRLGHASSHGCVRTHPVSARRIYNLVKRYGSKNTTIIVKE